MTRTNLYSDFIKYALVIRGKIIIKWFHQDVIKKQTELWWVWRIIKINDRTWKVIRDTRRIWNKIVYV